MRSLRRTILPLCECLYANAWNHEAAEGAHPSTRTCGSEDRLTSMDVLCRSCSRGLHARSSTPCGGARIACGVGRRPRRQAAGSKSTASRGSRVPGWPRHHSRSPGSALPPLWLSPVTGLPRSAASRRSSGFVGPRTRVVDLNGRAAPAGVHRLAFARRGPGNLGTALCADSSAAAQGCERNHREKLKARARPAAARHLDRRAGDPTIR